MKLSHELSKIFEREFEIVFEKEKAEFESPSIEGNAIWHKTTKQRAPRPKNPPKLATTRLKS